MAKTKPAKDKTTPIPSHVKDLTTPTVDLTTMKEVVPKKNTPKKAAPKKAAPKKVTTKKPAAKKTAAKKTAAERTIKVFTIPKIETKAEITKPTPEPTRKSARIAARRMSWSIRVVQSLERSCSGGKKAVAVEKKAVPFPPPDRRIEMICTFEALDCGILDGM